MGLLKPKKLGQIYEDGIPKQLKYGFYHYDEILELILTYGIKLYLFIIFDIYQWKEYKVCRFIIIMQRIMYRQHDNVFVLSTLLCLNVVSIR